MTNKAKSTPKANLSTTEEANISPALETEPDTTLSPISGVILPEASSRLKHTVDVARAFELRYKHNHTFKEIGEMLGVSKQAVQERLSRFIKILPDHQEIETFRQFKAKVLEAVQFKHIEALVDPSKIEKASLNNLAYAIQVLDQAIRLERDKPTENIMMVHLNVSKIKEKRQRLNP